MNCNICHSTSKFLFAKKILNIYDAEYFQCEKCGFIQIKNPHWLSEAYGSAISILDTGLVSRNLYFSSVTEKLLLKYFKPQGKFVDYGGGYGLFVRLMRDKGFHFYRQDIYCQNLFAEYFDITDLPEDNRKFELLTAFELFEHLEHPIAEIEKMLVLSESILFSTELQPDDIKNHEGWWYFSPESGQHISFYTKKSLESIAERFALNLYTDNTTLHLLTKKHFKKSPIETNSFSLISRIKRKLYTLLSSEKWKYQLKSLTQEDHDLMRKKLNHEK